MSISLPAELGVETARLPEAYLDAQKALAACLALDECAAWADKALALASYARQADDLELENLTKRIRARAVRRCGELLLEFDGRGGDRTKSGTPPDFAPPTRREAAQQAGLSRHQQEIATAIARIPEAVFEEQVEGAGRRAPRCWRRSIGRSAPRRTKRRSPR